MKSTEVKKFLKIFGLPLNVRTLPGKSQWIEAWIKSEWKTENGQRNMTFPGSFPESFRKVCIKIVYPTSSGLHDQVSAGNIGPYSISMLPHEWEQVITHYQDLVVSSQRPNETDYGYSQRVKDTLEGNKKTTDFWNS